MSDNSNKGEMLQRISDLERKNAELEDKLEKLQCKSINQQASAWSAVYDFVRKFVPEFSIMKGSGKEQVISAIDGLIKRNKELSKLINPQHLSARDAEVAAKAVLDYNLQLRKDLDDKLPVHCIGVHGDEYAAQLRDKAGE